MLFGRVVRPSAFNAALVSVDSREAEAMPEVRVVRDGSFIGVAAPNAQTAARAASAIKVEWKAEPQPSATVLYGYLRKQAVPSTQENVRGSIPEGLANANKRQLLTKPVRSIATAQ